MTERQAAFLAAMIAGAPSATQAAKDAGYAASSAYQRASELVSHSEIGPAIQAARTAQVVAVAQAQARLTASIIMASLNDTASEARGAKQYGAAVSAYGKLLDKVAPDLIDARMFVAEVPLKALSESDWLKEGE